MSDNSTIALLIALGIIAFFGTILGLALPYQHYQHEERMSCIAHGGVFTESGCTWSKGA